MENTIYNNILYSKVFNFDLLEHDYYIIAYHQVQTILTTPKSFSEV